MGSADSTTRATASFWRASTKAPSARIVRTTCMFAGSRASTSVSTVPPGAATMAERGAPPFAVCGVTSNWRVMTSRRPSCSRICAPPPSSGSELSSVGVGVLMSMARSDPSTAVNIVVPSVLTTSGSSMPGSCTLVPEAASGWPWPWPPSPVAEGVGVAGPLTVGSTALRLGPLPWAWARA